MQLGLGTTACVQLGLGTTARAMKASCLPQASPDMTGVTRHVCGCCCPVAAASLHHTALGLALLTAARLVLAMMCVVLAMMCLVLAMTCVAVAMTCQRIIPPRTQVLFPLGGLKKTRVRELAGLACLPNAHKRESMGLCFVGRRRFDRFLGEYLPQANGSRMPPPASNPPLTSPLAHISHHITSVLPHSAALRSQPRHTCMLHASLCFPLRKDTGTRSRSALLSVCPRSEEARRPSCEMVPIESYGARVCASTCACVSCAIFRE